MSGGIQYLVKMVFPSVLEKYSLFYPVNNVWKNFEVSIAGGLLTAGGVMIANSNEMLDRYGSDDDSNDDINVRVETYIVNDNIQGNYVVTILKGNVVVEILQCLFKDHIPIVSIGLQRDGYMLQFNEYVRHYKTLLFGDDYYDVRDIFIQYPQLNPKYNTEIDWENKINTLKMLVNDVSITDNDKL